ncbi:phosphatidylethanolamine N-methyltransferase /phosphatidyl-N-methylethanolamine N-methyltransferase [Mesorhizobium albiziae]|uniref:Phosphatidylethanolamine N-methyltransferase /phosphatidyl-N-methylethanolamine N-methyltransferase n=1 Tax=Neomesorhizobium albiziae TaxID=335020 RepID=A0A1I3WY51_9HYPH|nr:class I SAM-dependent methyltransferase [Mesorhizobium albiziae]GLS31970.1 SAM-dependent methyltransferase [Mesorhizobium albiziae]SFK12392.1 phosphatidylethanolamine N-methyltransferase /phosphatidyl-N-methylethanolamine N-methyltransferase [Mesorhizobium albiziae]
MARGTGLRKSLATKFDDELRFFKGWIDKPKAVGSIVPTSSVTARRMASVIDPNSGLPVLEVGPGTGVITRAILARGIKPENLHAVEYSEDFVRHLRKHYPGVDVIQGDAFDLDKTLGDKRDMIFDSVVSGVPLLNFPVTQRIAYLEGLLKRIPAGRPVVQLTYGPLSPIPAGRGNYTVKHFDFVIRNIPPTQLWIYRRPAD